MIYQALLAPTETPHSLREIKRALLTYDKVFLIDPDDRDVIPSNAFMSTILGMPLFGFNMGAVRPSGKIRNYDDQFTKTLEFSKKAIDQGLIEIQSTYQKAEENQFTIGGVPTGGYPLNTQFVFWLYRSMASDPGFLSEATLGIEHYAANLDEHPDLALKGIGDGAINDIAALPLLGKSNDSELDTALSNIARSRIASFIKYSGYCEAKNLIPVFSSPAYFGIANRLLKNATRTFESEDGDRYWSKRNRVLNFCHEEFLVDEKLDALSISDVISLRTKAWGQQARAREELFRSVFTLAREIESDDDFSKRVAPLIQKYRETSEEVVREREKLRFELKCDLGKATLALGTAITGLISQLESPAASVGLTLAAGGMWAFDEAKRYVPALKELRAQEDDMKRGAGFGLHNYFSRLNA